MSSTKFNSQIIIRKIYEHLEKHSFDVVRPQVFDKSGQPVFKNPLWLEVVGQQRKELSLDQVYKCFGQRYDIEHAFRFGKQKLLLATSQTPDK